MDETDIDHLATIVDYLNRYDLDEYENIRLTLDKQHDGTVAISLDRFTPNPSGTRTGQRVRLYTGEGLNLGYALSGMAHDLASPIVMGDEAITP